MSHDGKEDPVDIAKNAGQGWGYVIRDDRCRLALDRLYQWVDAKCGWQDLYKKKAQVADGYQLAASQIGRAASYAYLPESIKKTSNEISDAAKSAHNLSGELVKLIRENATLHIRLDECLSDSIRDGLGIILDSTLQHDDSLDQCRDAYIELRHWLDTEALIGVIEKFGERAANTASFDPVTARPRGDYVDEKVFFLEVCGVLEYAYGQPFIEIATKFTSAVFGNSKINTETTKKWWKRKKTYGDN